MRKVIYALASMFLLTNQVTALTRPFTAVPVASAASDAPNHTLTLNTNSASAIELVDNTPNFDSQDLQPLRAIQAQRAAEEAAAAAAAAAAARAAAAKRVRTIRTAVAPLTVATGDVWERLRNCEAGGSYTRNSGNGYYGAYQFDIGTWGNYGGYARADLAPPAVQDAKAQATQAARGWYPWPTCARKLGLL